MPGAAPAPGSRLGPRPPRRAAHRPGPGSGRRVGRRAPRCRGGEGSPGGAGTARLAEDQRLARDARERPHPAALDIHGGEARGAGVLARSGAARPEAGHVEVVEGRAPRRVPRLQPERQGSHHLFGLFGATPAGRTRVGSAGLGGNPGLRPSRFHGADRAAAVRGTRRSARRDGSLGRIARAAPGAGGARRVSRPGRRAVAAALPQDGRRGIARRAVAGEAEGRVRGETQGTAQQDAARRRGELAGQAGRARGSRALEGTSSGCRVAPRSGRRARGFHAGALVHLDAHSRQPAQRAGGDQAAAGDARPGRRSHARMARVEQKFDGFAVRRLELPTCRDRRTSVKPSNRRAVKPSNTSNRQYRQSVNPSIRQSVNPSRSVNPSIRQSVNPSSSVNPSIRQSANPSIRQSVIDPSRRSPPTRAAPRPRAARTCNRQGACRSAIA